MRHHDPQCAAVVEFDFGWENILFLEVPYNVDAETFVREEQVAGTENKCFHVLIPFGFLQNLHLCNFFSLWINSMHRAVFSRDPDLAPQHDLPLHDQGEVVGKNLSPVRIGNETGKGFIGQQLPLDPQQLRAGKVYLPYRPARIKGEIPAETSAQKELRRSLLSPWAPQVTKSLRFLGPFVQQTTVISHHGPPYTTLMLIVTVLMTVYFPLPASQLKY
jgi:hypothetical protein